MGKIVDEEPDPRTIKPDKHAAKRWPYRQADYSKVVTGTRNRPSKKAVAVICCIFLALFLGLCRKGDKPVTEATFGVGDATSMDNGGLFASPEAQKRQFASLYRLVIMTGDSCEGTYTAAAQALGGFSAGNLDVRAVKTIIETAVDHCRLAVANYDSLSVPTVLSSEIQNTARQSIEKCRAGSQARLDSLGTAQQIADGDIRLSLVRSLEEQQQLSQTKIMLCVAGLTNAGSKLGMSAQEIADAAD